MKEKIRQEAIQYDMLQLVKITEDGKIKKERKKNIKREAVRLVAIDPWRFIVLAWF